MLQGPYKAWKGQDLSAASLVGRCPSFSIVFKCFSIVVLIVFHQAPDEFVGDLELCGGVKGTEAGLRDHTMQMSTAIIKRRAGEDAAVGRPKKKPRAKAYTSLLAIDNALRSVCDIGLEKFKVPLLSDQADAEEADPQDWCMLSLASDQGPDMVAAVSFLQYQLKLCIDVTFDLSHRSWNDVKHMYKDSKLWPHVLLMAAAQNVAFGSELSPNRLLQIRQAFTEYQKIMSYQTCPIFHQFLPRILAEQGQHHLLHMQGLAEQEIWESMLSDPVLCNMGERVNLGRFMGAVRRTQQDMQVWSKRAWVYTVAGMMFGL